MFFSNWVNNEWQFFLLAAGLLNSLRGSQNTANFEIIKNQAKVIVAFAILLRKTRR